MENLYFEELYMNVPSGYIAVVITLRLNTLVNSWRQKQAKKILTDTDYKYFYVQLTSLYFLLLAPLSWDACAFIFIKALLLSRLSLETSTWACL